MSFKLFPTFSQSPANAELANSTPGDLGDESAPGADADAPQQALDDKLRLAYLWALNSADTGLCDDIDYRFEESLFSNLV